LDVFHPEEYHIYGLRGILNQAKLVIIGCTSEERRVFTQSGWFFGTCVSCADLRCHKPCSKPNQMLKVYAKSAMQPPAASRIF